MTEERKRGNTDWLVIAVAVAAVLAAAWILSGPVPAAVSWLSQSVLNAIFVGLSWTASRRAGLSPVARRFWHGAIFGGALFTVGTLLQAALALSGSWDNAGSAKVPTIVMSVGIASVIGFMFTNPLGSTGRDSLRLWLDATTVMVAVLVLVWLIAVSVYKVINPGALALTVVGGALALVSVFAILRTLVTRSAPFPVATGLTAALATSLFGVEYILNPLIAETEHFRPVLVARLVPPLLLVIAARVGARLPVAGQAERPEPSYRHRIPYSRLPSVAVVVTQFLWFIQLVIDGLNVRTWGTIAGLMLIVVLVVVRQNIAVTDNERLQDSLRHAAYHDNLTGLANRALVYERADHDVGAVDESATCTAVLMIDLDDFKAVNDGLGHQLGDQLLVAVADRLRRCVRANDTVARLGGDEFAVLLEDTSRSDAVATARRIQAALSEPLTVENHTLAARGSVGIAVGTDRPFDALLREADAAMYEAKRDPRRGVPYMASPTGAKPAKSTAEPGP